MSLPGCKCNPCYCIVIYYIECIKLFSFYCKDTSRINNNFIMPIDCEHVLNNSFSHTQPMEVLQRTKRRKGKTRQEKVDHQNKAKKKKEKHFQSEMQRRRKNSVWKIMVLCCCRSNIWLINKMQHFNRTRIEPRKNHQKQTEELVQKREKSDVVRFC